MEAQIHTVGDLCIIHLKGRVDVEANEKFRQTCLEHLGAKKVVFNLQDLSFVGSNGITSFVETFALLSQRSNAGIKICSVGSEFRRIFESSEIQNLNIYEDEQKAKMSFLDQSIRPLSPFIESSPEDLEKPV